MWYNQCSYVSNLDNNFLTDLARDILLILHYNHWKCFTLYILRNVRSVQNHWKFYRLKYYQIIWPHNVTKMTRSTPNYSTWVKRSLCIFVIIRFSSTLTLWTSYVIAYNTSVIQLLNIVVQDCYSRTRRNLAGKWIMCE